MREQYITRTVTWLSDGVTQSTTVQEAQYGTRGQAKGFRKWYVCHNCAFSYPEDDIMLINGVPYCAPRKCYKDFI